MSKPSRSRLRRLLDRMLRWWKPEPESAGDPYAHRMAPVRRGPKGRSGAAAVAEPEEDTGFLSDGC
jgi:hypothetical protein